jgi:hypothetical protein
MKKMADADCCKCADYYYLVAGVIIAKLAPEFRSVYSYALPY